MQEAAQALRLISEGRIIGTLQQQTAVHSLTATAGRQYLIDLTSQSFNTKLTLKNPDGDVIGYSHGSGVSLNSRINFIARRDGVLPDRRFGVSW